MHRCPQRQRPGEGRLTPAATADTARGAAGAIPLRRPTILVDFDGVWTDMRGQAEAVVTGARQRLATLGRIEPKAVDDALERARSLVRSAPPEHGWRVNGRITAYADEDPFLFHNATMAAGDKLAASGDPALMSLREAVRAEGHADLSAFGSAVFSDASHAFLADHGHDLLPGALEALGSLSEVADIVICTNFASEAVASTWLRHGVRFGTEGRLRLRGGARKQELTADPERSVSFGGRSIFVDRSFYRRTLIEEAPDAVVGDVFSLDLGLPLLLRQELPQFRNLQCVLARTPFSCAWSLGIVQEPQNHVLTIGHPSELTELARHISLEEVPPC